MNIDLSLAYVFMYCCCLAHANNIEEGGSLCVLMGLEGQMSRGLLMSQVTEDFKTVGFVV